MVDNGFIVGKRIQFLILLASWMFVGFVNSFSLAQGKGSIAGMVRNAKTGLAVAGVNVSIKGTSAGAATTWQGEYAIGDVTPGTYVLLFSAVGYENVELTDVAVKAADTTTVDIMMVEEVIAMGDILVIGASRRSERITEAPAAISKLSGLHVRQFSGTGQIAGLFDAEPGVDIVQNGINDFNINSRGFNTTLNRRVLVLLDNRETAMSFLLAQEWNSYSLPLEDLGELEFVRGPGSALYGANAFSGVINIKTPDPGEIVGTKVSLAAGELNSVRGDIRHAGLYGRWGYKFNVGGVRSETWSKSRDVSQQKLDMQEYRGLTPEFIPLEDNDLSTIYGSGRVDYNFSDNSTAIAEAGIAEAQDQVFVTGIGRVQVDDVIRPWGRASFSSEQFFFQVDYNGRKTLKGHQRALNSVVVFEESSYDLNFQFQNRYSTLDKKLRVVWGASHRFQHVDTERTLTPDTYDENQSGLYGQLEYELSPTINVMAAGRVDRSTLHSTQLSPKAAMVFSPTANHSFRATFNRGFQSPNYAEFFLEAPFGGKIDLAPLEQEIEVTIEQMENLPRGTVDLPLDFDLTPRTARGNEELEVEKVLGFEIGYKGGYQDRLFVTTDFYFSRLTDFITDLLPGVNPAFLPYEVPADIPEQRRQIAKQMIRDFQDSLGTVLTTLPDGSKAFVVSYTNAGTVHEWGVELGLNSYLTKEVILRGNYTYFDFDVKDKATGDILLPNTPGHKFNIGLSYEGQQGIDFNIRLKYVEGFEWAAGIFQGHVPSYTVVDLAGGYKLYPRTRLGVVVTNALDDEHYELFGGSVNGRRALATVTFEF